MLYEILTGAKLFRGDSLTNVLHNVATFEPPPPSRIKPEVTHLLDLVIKRAMEKKPSDRYSSAWEMVDDLRHCLQELAPPTRAAQIDAESKTTKAAPTEDAPLKTQILKPQTGDKQTLRRMSRDMNTDNRMNMSRRFDSSDALTRLQQPTPRDRKRLSRTPHMPGLLRRLLHDHDLALFTLTITVVVLLAGVLALS